VQCSFNVDELAALDRELETALQRRQAALIPRLSPAGTRSATLRFGQPNRWLNMAGF